MNLIGCKSLQFTDIDREQQHRLTYNRLITMDFD